MNPQLLRRVVIAGTAIAALGTGIAIAKPDIFTKQSLLSSQVAAQSPTTTISAGQRRQTGWLQELNLTPEQIKQIKVIHRQSKDSVTSKANAVRQDQEELRQLIASGSPKQQVLDKYNQLKKLKQDLTDAQFENTLAIREILNPEQRLKFANHIQKPQKVINQSSNTNNIQKPQQNLNQSSNNIKQN